MLRDYNGGTLLGNSPGATTQESKLFDLDVNSKDNIEQALTSARGGYLATAFLLSSYRRRYGELIMALKNDYDKQQHNYPKILTYIYGLMVTFEPMR